jgi:hypothetical protein
VSWILGNDRRSLLILIYNYNRAATERTTKAQRAHKEIRGVPPSLSSLRATVSSTGQLQGRGCCRCLGPGCGSWFIRGAGPSGAAAMSSGRAGLPCKRSHSRAEGPVGPDTPRSWGKGVRLYLKDGLQHSNHRHSQNWTSMKKHWVDEKNDMNEQFIRRDVEWGLYGDD